MAATRTILLAVGHNDHPEHRIGRQSTTPASQVVHGTSAPTTAPGALQNFHPSDRIAFKYSPQAHDALEVSKADHDSCSTASPIATLNSGNDVAPHGHRYPLLHAASGHRWGMKVKIDVVSSSSSSSPAPPAVLQ
ncbi:hypothetical protein ZWY2020_011778 [Hordeum vulgare]|nr:hypothetical protein ZWY2020_011778 [Hordeum vulgare]